MMRLKEIINYIGSYSSIIINIKGKSNPLVFSNKETLINHYNGKLLNYFLDEEAINSEDCGTLEINIKKYINPKSTNWKKVNND